MITLKPVASSEVERLIQIAAAYWQDLMPHSDRMQDGEQRHQYFQERFPLDRPNHLVQWAIAAEATVGLVACEVEPARKRASIKDFYILPHERRRGYGAAMLGKLCEQFDKLGIEQIDLNVRRDNPAALVFWEAQGFRVALYQLRQYRDPQTGESFIGALSSDFQ